MSTRLTSLLMDSIYKGWLDYPNQYGPANLQARILSFHEGETLTIRFHAGHQVQLDLVGRAQMLVEPFLIDLTFGSVKSHT